MIERSMQATIDAFNGSYDAPVIKWRCSRFCSHIDFYVDSFYHDEGCAHYAVQDISELMWQSYGEANEGDIFGYRKPGGPDYQYAWLRVDSNQQSKGYQFDSVLTFLSFKGVCQSIRLEQLPYREPVESGQEVNPPADYYAADFAALEMALTDFLTHAYLLESLEGLYHGSEAHLVFTQTTGQRQRLELRRLVRFEKQGLDAKPCESYTLQPGVVTATVNGQTKTVQTATLTFPCRGYCYTIEFMEARLVAV